MIAGVALAVDLTESENSVISQLPAQTPLVTYGLETVIKSAANAPNRAPLTAHPLLYALYINYKVLR